MESVESLSEKRLLVHGVRGGRHEVYLLDTGASVSLLSKRTKGVKRGRVYNGTLIGAGGGLETAYIADDVVEVCGRKFTQFVVCDIDAIVASIRRETGRSISGIIGLPMMRANGVRIDVNSNLIGFEEDGD